MLKIALTGGIGCGKSTVCQLFSQLNVPVIDTDIIAHNLVKPGSLALQEITHFFGKEILLNDQSLNRQRLSHIVFNHPEKKKQLESVLHPKIKQHIQQQLEQITSPYVIIAIPLLIETHQQNTYDHILVIDCDEQQQIERTLARDTRDLSEIKSIIQSQASRNSRLAIANDIINNSSDISFLQLQVEQLHKKLTKLSQ